MSRKTQAQRVREILENEMASGKLPPGSRVDEDSVATRLEVSRTPVREAVLQMVQDGLLEKRPRQGAFVPSLGLREMVQMFEFTAELSGICGKYAARRMTPDNLRELRAMHKMMESLLGKGDIHAYADMNTDFHVYIMRLARNNYMFDTTHNYGLRLLGYFRTHLFYPGKAEQDYHDHCTLMGAFERQDGDLAYELLRQHATIHGDVLAEYLLHSEPSPVAASRPAPVRMTKPAA